MTHPNTNLLTALILAAFSGLACTPSTAQTPPRGTLLQFDFNGKNPWPQTATDVMPSTPLDVLTTIEAKPVGTIDEAGSTTPSGGMLIKAEVGDVGLPWIATYTSGLFPIKNTETNLGKLTLSLSLSASSARPVIVRVESFNTTKNRTGGLETTIYPAAPDFYQRYALDLSTMQPSGEGKFDPADPNIQFTFELRNPDWPSNGAHEVRIDNVQLAIPAYYVSEKGDDKNDGRTEKTAFATPQKAVDMAQPGDIILVMNGTYGKVEGRPAQSPVASFNRPGTPSAWIALKNYPGHTPMFSAAGQIGVKISRPAKSTEPPLSYIEVRGLHIRGNGDTAKTEFPNDIGTWSPNTNSQGIHVNGAGIAPRLAHHIRLADNNVEFCTNNGVYLDYVDWMYVEDNQIRNNCWTTIDYAPAGLAVMHYADFDGTDNTHKFLIAGNHVSGNKLTVFNSPYGKTRTTYFNGNGMLLDANAEKAGEAYRGRTLVQNNLVFGNGAGGIQMWGNHRMDLIHNTVYMNGISPETRWGQVGMERCRDVRLINNTIVGSAETPLNSWFQKPDKATDIVRLNNFYFGGSVPPIAGGGDIIADPMFVNASLDPKVADFRLKPGSPALGAGRNEAFGRFLDINGKPRGAKPDKGAFQG